MHRAITPRRAAALVSTIGHPLIVLPLAVWVRSSNYQLPFASNSAIVLIAISIAVIIAVYSLRQVRRGSWIDTDASKPNERRQLHRVVAAILVVSAALSLGLRLPNDLTLGLFAVAGMVGMAELILPWLKLSLHTGFAAFASILVWPNFYAALMFAVLTCAIAWSRLHLRRHSLAEVTFGGVLGAVVAGFYLFGIACSASA